MNRIQHTRQAPFLMKTQFAFLALLALSLLASPAAQAQKVGTIDLKKVFDGYWKTKRADELLKERQDGFQSARKSLIDEYEAANAEYRSLVEEANDQAITDEERAKRKKDVDAKVLDLKEIENSIQQFDRQAVTTLEDQKKRARNDIVREITDLVITVAKRERYALVLDTSGHSHNQSPLVMYSDGSADISAEILKMLNANVPPEYKSQIQ